MNCNKCWRFPCTCGEQYKHMSANDLRQILANLSIADNKELWSALSLLLVQKDAIDKSWEGPNNQ